MQPLRNWLLLLLQSSHSPCNSPEPPSRLPHWLLETVALHIKLSPLLPVFSARTCGWIVRLQALFLRSSLCRWVRCCYLNRESICGPAFTVDLYLQTLTSSYDLWLCQTTLMSDECEFAARLQTATGRTWNAAPRKPLHHHAAPPNTAAHTSIFRPVCIWTDFLAAHSPVHHMLKIQCYVCYMILVTPLHHNFSQTRCF